MRKILIATHGEFAGGLKQTMDFVLGGNEKVGERVYHTGF
mgnify:CR=1 FL=1